MVVKFRFRTAEKGSSGVYGVVLPGRVHAVREVGSDLSQKPLWAPQLVRRFLPLKARLTDA